MLLRTFLFSLRFHTYRSFGRKYIKHNSHVLNHGLNVTSPHRLRDRCSRDNSGCFGFRHDVIFNTLFTGPREQRTSVQDKHCFVFHWIRHFWGLNFKSNENKIKFIILYDNISMTELFLSLHDAFINLDLTVWKRHWI